MAKSGVKRFFDRQDAKCAKETSKSRFPSAWLGALGVLVLGTIHKNHQRVIFATGGTQKGPLFIWSAVFLLVTLQMTTSPRPILGRSEVRLTQEKKFFLAHWGDTFGTSLPPAVHKRQAEGSTNER